VTLTTERANPLRRWNPDWGGCPTARRPVAAVNALCQRRSVFVKRFTHEMTRRDGSPGYRAHVQFRVDRVPASMTWELRQTVLRPHQTIEQLALPDDNEMSTGSFAAINPDGEVVGTARVAPASPPFPVGLHAPANWPTWQLRGMATREDVRNEGVGTALVRRFVSHVSGEGGGLLWCNARVPAMDFYRRVGFVVHGDVWEEPDIGPHVVMWRTV
jgi:predicted GNAT family N-acyltransferase